MPKRNPLVALGVAAMAVLALAALARCQEILPPRKVAAANRLFESASQTASLKCRIERRRPSLDFTFRFDAGYLIACPVRQFGGRRTRITILTRVTPEGGTPVVLGTSAIFRGLPPERLMVRGRGKAWFEVGGGFSVGEGRYRVEVLVADPDRRTCRREWWIKVPHRRQRKVPVVVAPHHVSSLQVPPWRGPRAKDGLRLAVLLSATSYNPYRSRLEAWNRIRLLQILSALLQQTPCTSVSLVAFNLDQLRVIYQTDSFQPSGFGWLRRSFERLELGTVSVHTLQRRNEWAQMLAGLANRQLAAQPPPDAVVVLGRTARWVHKVPKEFLKPRETDKPQFFYFENGPNNLFPDALGYLTESLGGKIYRINTPDDLGKGIQKMLARLGQAGREAKYSPARQDKGAGRSAAPAP